MIFGFIIHQFVCYRNHKLKAVKCFLCYAANGYSFNGPEELMTSESVSHLIQKNTIVYTPEPCLTTHVKPKVC